MGEKRSPDDPEQARRFEEAARAVEADESGRVFQRAFKKIVPPVKRKRKKL